MSSPSTVVTLGLGTFGSVGAVLLLGLGAAPPAVGYPTPSERTYNITAELRRVETVAEYRYVDVTAENRLLYVERTSRRIQAPFENRRDTLQ